jgi:NAD(P)-dependent dehydrogenase (short-subunit alcohol dehydrogenase family)
MCAGVNGLAGLCAYTASKHAVVGMMRCAAAEYGPLGLRVNCINPGAVGEHMTQEPRLGLKMQQDEQRCTIALLVGYNIDVM